MRRLIAVVVMVLFATACTPEEISLFWEHTRPAREGAEARGLDGDRLGALVACESGGDPGAVSASGRYRGLGQFDQRTWDGVAGRWFPHLVGVDPATVEWFWQHAMIWALWSERGDAPWPVCG